VQLRDLQDMTIGQRIVLTFVIVVIILLAFAAYGYFSGAWDRADAQQASLRPTDLYGDTPLDATLLRLDRDTLREAYQAQLLKLWGVWLATGAPADATQFKNGMNNARRAYGLAAQALNRREAELLIQEQQHRDQQEMRENPEKAK
jgi:hypothetical protein